MSRLIEAWREGWVRTAGGPVAVLGHLETHLSWVFLTIDRVYKLKKAIRLPFVDYSTVTRRAEGLRQELSLGCRTSPQVYVGLAGCAVVDSQVVVTDEPTDEPVLIMHRLPEEVRADRVFSVPGEAARVVPVVRAAVDFHARCPITFERGGTLAVARAVRAWEANFEEMPEDAGALPLRSDERRLLLHQTAEWVDTLRPVLARRAAEGRVREGHGDLRLEHVYLTDPPSIIDPLEFSQELRTADVAAEIGFLAMELDELKRSDVADVAVSEFQRLTGDPTLPDVLPFFKRYRAVVRAKVEWFRSMQATGGQRDAYLARSGQLFALALGYDLAAPHRS